MPDDSFSRLSGWHALSSQAQANLVSLIQNPSAFSHLLALQQAMFSSPPNPSDDLHPYTEAVTARSSMTGMFSRSHQGPQLTNSQDTPYLARPTASFPNASGLNIQLPSPPQLDRSLLRAPSWALPSGCNGPATLSAAETSATQQAASGFNQPPQPVADFSSDLFRSTSMGSRYLSTPLPAELSLRASSMPGSFQDIAARLHLNRAGINTATASMIPVLSQDWLVIPFGTAQQLLPVYAGDMLAEDGGDAVMLIDETGRNWPMKCAYCRKQGRFQLGEGWRAFAQHWGLGHGEQLQLSRRFVSSGCIWLDVQLVTSASTHAVEAVTGGDGGTKRKRETSVEAPAKARSPVAAWISRTCNTTPQPVVHRHTAISLQEQSALHDTPVQPTMSAEPERRPLISVQRLISCPTYCSRLHVNQHMAEHLLPVLPEAASMKPPLSYVYQSLFKHKISIMDENREAWLVQYEGFVSAAQRHYRFTAGWTNLVKQKGIRVGDAIVLERWTADRFKLHMHIIKNASDSIIIATGSKGKAKRSTARTAQHGVKGRTPAKSRTSSRQAPKPYSPGSLEALHDAALLCADSPSFVPGSDTALDSTQDVAGSPSVNAFEGGSAVPAAAVAAADAAALSLEGSQLAMASGLIALRGNQDRHSLAASCLPAHTSSVPHTLS